MSTKITVKKLEKGEVEIKGEIAFETILKHKKTALNRIGESVTLAGFRKGHIPENVLEKHVGEKAILEEMAEIAIAKEYPEILAGNKLFPLTRPKISLTKLAKDNPLEFTITLVTMPEIEIADYKKIAKLENIKPKEIIEVTEKEVEDFIVNIRKSHIDHSKHDHSVSKEEHEKMLEKEMPELTLEFIKKLGDFKDIVDFKNKIKENIAEDKKMKAHDKRRLQALDAIVKETKVELPTVLVENELNKMTEQFKADIARMGATIESYLTHIKKTEAEMRKDWEKDAEKRVMIQLILGKIAGTEKIEADKEELEKQVAYLLKQHKDADPSRARDYVEVMLTNEKVFKFLETL